jgi:hypothetical protein
MPEQAREQVFAPSAESPAVRIATRQRPGGNVMNSNASANSWRCSCRPRVRVSQTSCPAPGCATPAKHKKFDSCGDAMCGTIILAEAGYRFKGQDRTARVL